MPPSALLTRFLTNKFTLLLPNLRQKQVNEKLRRASEYRKDNIYFEENQKMIFARNYETPQR